MENHIFRIVLGMFVLFVITALITLVEALRAGNEDAIAGVFIVVLLVLMYFLGWLAQFIFKKIKK